MAVPRIDHLVVDVGDRIDEAARRYRALGFNLTERAHHSIGSANHLAMFDPDYIELLSPGSGARPELAGFPVGMNGLVFAMQGAEAVHTDQLSRGVKVQSVQYFTRGANLPDGTQATARFNVVRLEPREVFDGRVYFCEHLTPEFVWRPEWQAHPNGALAISRVALATRDPGSVAAIFDNMFGAGSVVRAGATDSPHVLMAGNVAVEIWPAAALGRTLGDAMPDPAGRGDHIALFGLRVRSRDVTRDMLRTNNIGGVRADHDRILVPSHEAMNVAVEFIA